MHLAGVVAPRSHSYEKRCLLLLPLVANVRRFLIPRRT
jgi:hypothetical protein